MPAPYLPPPRRVLPPPPLPSSEGHDKNEPETRNKDESTAPSSAGGIYARIASLNLNQVGLNPSSRLSRASRPSSLYLSSPSSSSSSSVSSFSLPSSPPPSSAISQPSRLSLLAEVPEDKLTQLLRRRPPVPPTRHTSTPTPRRATEFSDTSVSLHVTHVPASGFLPETAVSRPPPPMRSLPPPPPCIPTHNLSMPTFVPGVSCIKCHDFSEVDFHAKSITLDSSFSQELVNALTEPFDTETEKARALFVWFYCSTAYEIRKLVDIVGPNDDPDTLRQHFINICAGFAQLFLELTKYAGLQGYLVWGYSKTYEHRPTSKSGQSLLPYDSNDAWNCILLDGQWHLIVPTWGRGLLSETEPLPHFASRWFTSSPLEFRQTHYPEDPTYQLVSEDDGGPITWETFITAQQGPKINGDFHERDLHPTRIDPYTAKLRSGQSYTFSIFKKCEHLSMSYEDNYCFVVFLPEFSIMEPLIHNAEGGLSVTLPLSNSADGTTVCLGAVKTIAGKDAKGLTPQNFNRRQIRQNADIQVLVQWDIV